VTVTGSVRLAKRKWAQNECQWRQGESSESDKSGECHELAAGRLAAAAQITAATAIVSHVDE